MTRSFAAGIIFALILIWLLSREDNPQPRKASVLHPDFRADVPA